MFNLSPILVLATGAGSHPSALIWTGLLVVLSALIIAWAAEAAQFLIAQGVALALLALIQTLPEYSVEAHLAWAAGKDAEKLIFVTANFTGALRLLIGLGWPLIFLTAFFASLRQGKILGEVRLEDQHSVEIVSFFPPMTYGLLIALKGSIALYDAAVLASLYAGVVYFLWLCPPEREDKIAEADFLPRLILQSGRRLRVLLILLCFLAGGLILYFTVHPFVEACKAAGIALGVAPYIMIQWIAPILSEFPEKISAFNWARKITKAPMAVMNMSSSILQEATLLIALMPVVYALSRGDLTPIHLEPEQTSEILLTISQGALGAVLLLDLRLSVWEAVGLLCIWVAQLGAGIAWSASSPEKVVAIHQLLTVLSWSWAGLEVLRYALRRKTPPAFSSFRQVVLAAKKRSSEKIARA